MGERVNDGADEPGRGLVSPRGPLVTLEWGKVGPPGLREAVVKSLRDVQVSETIKEAMLDSLRGMDFKAEIRRDLLPRVRAAVDRHLENRIKAVIGRVSAQVLDELLVRSMDALILDARRRMTRRRKERKKVG